MDKRLALVVLAACGGGSNPAADSAVTADGPPGFDGPPSDAPAADACPASPNATVVFLNRGGGTYTVGADNSSANVSTSVDTTRTVSVTTVDADWTAVMSCVRAKFAPFDVVVTDVDPGAADHTELVMIDSAVQIGQPDGVYGITGHACAPSTPTGVPVDHAVAFQVWADLGNDFRCNLAAQMLGYAFGLDRQLGCADVMSYEFACPDKTFTDNTVACGETSPRDCQCGGQTQNSYQYLATTIGVATCP